jgi:hypothetical protein
MNLYTLVGAKYIYTVCQIIENKGYEENDEPQPQLWWSWG